MRLHRLLRNSFLSPVSCGLRDDPVIRVDSSGQRYDQSPALWVTHSCAGSERLSCGGLRAVITRRAFDSHVEEPSQHDFRRAIALAMLRNGTDVFTLEKLMGHEGISVLRRYLKQTDLDTEKAHRRAGPVDNGF